MQYLTASQAALRLGITPTTLRNWRRAGVVQPAAAPGAGYDPAEIEQLLSQLQAGTLGRLQSGVNRAHAGRLQLPREYGLSGEQQRLLRQLARQFGASGLPLEPLLFLAALRWLERRGELRLRGPSGCWFEARRRCVREALEGWRARLELPEQPPELPEPSPEQPPEPSPVQPPELPDLLARYGPLLRLCDRLEGEDPLGLLYLGLQSVGQRSRQGVWFTPGEQVEAALRGVSFPVGRLLDPCVGTGQYLVGAARGLGLSPEQLFGWDRDPVMVELARLNLLLAFPGRELEPQLSCRDALERLPEALESSLRFDVVLGNPPWGGRQAALAEERAGLEPFARFVRRGLELLQVGGRLSFLLPTSILNVRKHAGIREEVLRGARMVRVVDAGQPFTRVVSSVLRLELEKGEVPPGWRVELVSAEGSSEWVEQAQWASAREFRWRLGGRTGAHGRWERLWERLLQCPHQTLEGRGAWALGIVTGNNRGLLTDQPGEGREPLWRGREVFPYRLGPSRTYLRVGVGALQQRAPEHLYRAPEKLIYRFISKRLCFAYDDQQRLTLNSANGLIPALPGMGVKVVLGYLNSWLFQRVFEQVFATHKVLKQDLERLPFPLLDEVQHRRLEGLVDRALVEGETSPDLERLVLESFGVEPSDVEGWPY